MRSGSLPSTAHDRRHRLPGRQRAERDVRARAPRAPVPARRRRPTRSRASERLILPGVGAARATLDSLAEQGLVEPLAGACPRRRRAVPRHLHRAPGAVRPQRGGRHRRASAGYRARCGGSPTTAACRRSGGTRCGSRASTRSPSELPDDGHFYFVNSYYCAPTDPDDVLGVTDYGVEFCSVVARGNIVATQFHAEKSGALGLALLRGFADVGRPRADEATHRVLRRDRRSRHEGPAVPGQHRRRAGRGARRSASTTTRSTRSSSTTSPRAPRSARSTSRPCGASRTTCSCRSPSAAASARSTTCSRCSRPARRRSASTRWRCATPRSSARAPRRSAASASCSARR